MNTWLKQNTMLGIGLFVLVTLVIAYFFGSRTGKGKAEASEEKELQKEINQNPLSYEKSQFSGFADRLEQAMTGFADDEATIYAVFSKLRNRSDVLQLIEVFGNRRMSFTIGSSNLTTWLNYRLSKPEIGKINEILERNNINYQF